MGKLAGLFGRSEDKGDQTDEAPASEETPPVAEADPRATATQPVFVQTNPYATIDDYAASLPAPDYVDPAGKASAA